MLQKIEAKKVSELELDKGMRHLLGPVFLMIFSFLSYSSFIFPVKTKQDTG